MNSLYNELVQQSSPMQKLFNMIKTAKDPNAMMNQIIQQNPQMQQVFQIINQNGGDPKMAFYKLAQEKGIDPEQILSMFR